MFKLMENAEELLPHSGDMALIDKVLRCDEHSLEAIAILGEKHIFLQNGLFPSWGALELMAQGVAAWAGVQAKNAGEEVRLGFLLGARKLQFYFETLAIPSTVLIKIKLSLQDNQGFGIFDTELWQCDEQYQAQVLLAESVLNVFSPKEEYKIG